MPFDAILTNAITNFLHAICLFIYFVSASIHYLKKEHTFTILTVLFFLTLFILKILGVFVHYFDVNASLSPGWLAITLLTIMLNYLLVQSIDMPDITRITAMFLSIFSTFLFLTSNGDFTYIALPITLVYSIAAYYTRSMLRLGFLMVITANIVWTVIRHIENHILGHEIPIEARYDNDIYHLFLIVSTFIIYKAGAKGYWVSTKRSS